MGRDGSLDRLCWPRFESPALFCRPVGRPGERAIANSAQDGTARTSRAYRQNTLILGTQFETDGGAVLLSDFMPLRGANSDVVRRVTGLRGRVAMKLELIVRFDYGRTVPWGSRLDDGCLRLTAGPNMLILRSDVELAGRTWLRSASSRSRPHESPHFFLTRSSPVSQPLRRPCL
jgi:GH15 family glucan-1,4-alpha-glucosidase